MPSPGCALGIYSTLYRVLFVEQCRRGGENGVSSPGCALDIYSMLYRVLFVELCMLFIVKRCNMEGLGEEGGRGRF